MIVALISSFAAQGDELVLPPAEFSGLAQPGTVIRWIDQDGKKHETTIGEPDGFVVKWSTDGTGHSNYARFANIEIPVEAKPGVEVLWPLRVGNSTSYVYTSEGDEYSVMITVVGTESVTVPAGTFDTYVVSYDSRATEGDWTGKGRYWWSPQVGWLVKYEWVTSNKEAESGELLGSSAVTSQVTTVDPSTLPQRIYDHVMATALSEKVGRSITSQELIGQTNPYRRKERNKALAACLIFAGDSLSGIGVRYWFMTYENRTSREARGEATKNCRYRERDFGCTCFLVDVNDENVVASDEELLARVKR